MLKDRWQDIAKEEWSTQFFESKLGETGRIFCPAACAPEFSLSRRDQ
jgi:hypothetical protein